MANKCIKTQLESVVNNDNLSKLGILTLKTNFAGNESISNRLMVISPISTKTIKLKAIGGNFVNSSDEVISDTLTVSTGTNVRVQASVQYIEIEKYNILYLSTESMPTASFKLSEFDYTNIATLKIVGSNQSGDISAFSKISTLVDLTARCPIKGDILSLAELSLVNFNSNSTSIFGDFASWAPYKSAGTAITITVPGTIGRQLKCNGVLLGGNTTNYTLTFDGAGNVTCTER